MAEAKQSYKIKLSEEARRILTNRQQQHFEVDPHLFRYQQPTGMYRASVSSYFHNSYEDARTPMLIELRTWSLSDKPLETMVRLTDTQVKDVLQLAKLHNIDMNPPQFTTVGRPLTKYGVKKYLLSSFLDAVLMGNLKEVHK